MAYLNLWRGHLGVIKPNYRLRLIRDHPFAQNLVFSLPLDLNGYNATIQEHVYGAYVTPTWTHDFHKWRTSPYGPVFHPTQLGSTDDSFVEWPASHPLSYRLDGLFRFTMMQGISRSAESARFGTDASSRFAGLTAMTTNNQRRLNLGTSQSARMVVTAPNAAQTGSTECRFSNLELDSDFSATGIDPRGILQQMMFSVSATNSTDWQNGGGFWRRRARLVSTVPGAAGNIITSSVGHQVNTNTEGIQLGIGAATEPLRAWRWQWGSIESSSAARHYFHVWADRAFTDAEQDEFNNNPYNMFEPAPVAPKFYFVSNGASGTLEYLRPDGVDAAGGWRDVTGGTANLHTNIDEESFSDTDFVMSEGNPVTDVFRVTMSNPVGTVNPAQPIKVRYRYKKVGAGTINLTVRLKEGATTRASWVHNGITETYVTAEQTLSAGEASSVTDWNNVLLEFEADAP